MDSSTRYIVSFSHIKNIYLSNSRIHFFPLSEKLEKEMAAHSSSLAWRILWTEKPGGLQSSGSQRVRHDRLSLFLFQVRSRWRGAVGGGGDVVVF